MAANRAVRLLEQVAAGTFNIEEPDSPTLETTERRGRVSKRGRGISRNTARRGVSLAPVLIQPLQGWALPGLTQGRRCRANPGLNDATLSGCKTCASEHSPETAPSSMELRRQLACPNSCGGRQVWEQGATKLCLAF